MSLSTLLAAMALVAAGVCAALAFTGWGKRRPLHRYGALSIAAHLLLLAAMAGIRVGGPPRTGDENAPAVKVRIVMRTTEPAIPEAEPLEEPPAPETKPEETPASNEAPMTPPPLLAEAAATQPAPQEPVREPEPQPKAVEPAPPLPVDDWILDSQAAAEVSEPPPPESQPEPTPEPKVVQPASIEPIQRSAPPVADPTPATPSPLTPAAYAQRGELAKRRLSADEGGSQETLDAVAAAVDWLARAQGGRGAWESERWGAGRETYTLDQDRKGAGTGAETGLTALALLAMGGAGHTHLAGPYRDVVTAGLQYLLDQQEPDGSLAGDSTLYARTYCHSMATFALAEAMAVSKDERLRPAVEAAVGYLARSQNRADGGWRYQPGDRGDMSQMGWAVMALRSAELAGVAVPPQTWTGCERFVASVRRGQHGGLACYQPLGPTTSTMTAEAMYCRQILGVSRGRSAADEEAVAYLLTDLPGSPDCRSCPGGKMNLYYWYYATLALHHHHSTNSMAAPSWRQWNDAMQRAILPRQVAQGRDAGSWGADTVWGGYGGRVYSTALAAMCLEVYYRYDAETIGRDPWIAARPEVLRR